MAIEDGGSFNVMGLMRLCRRPWETLLKEVLSDPTSFKRLTAPAAIGRHIEFRTVNAEGHTVRGPEEVISSRGITGREVTNKWINSEINKMVIISGYYGRMSIPPKPPVGEEISKEAVSCIAHSPPRSTLRNVEKLPNEGPSQLNHSSQPQRNPTTETGELPPGPNPAQRNPTTEAKGLLPGPNPAKSTVFRFLKPPGL